MNDATGEQSSVFFLFTEQYKEGRQSRLEVGFQKENQ